MGGILRYLSFTVVCVSLSESKQAMDLRMHCAHKIDIFFFFRG